MIGGLSKFVFNQLLFVSELKTTSFGHRTDTHGDGDRRRVRKDVQRCTSIFNNVEYFSMSGGVQQNIVACLDHLELWIMFCRKQLRTSNCL